MNPILIKPDGWVPYPPAGETYTEKELEVVEAPMVPILLPDGTILIVTMDDPRKPRNREATEIYKTTGFAGVVRGNVIHCERGMYKKARGMYRKIA